MDTTILVQAMILLGGVVASVGSVWAVWIQTKQKSSKDKMDAQALLQQQRLEDIKELRDRIDEQDERIESMGKKLDRVSRDLRMEQTLTHRMSLTMQTHDIFLDQIEEYYTEHDAVLPYPRPHIPNRHNLKMLLDTIANRDRGDPE
ncbi:hypothetical protein FGG66_gp23 [Corynebacterium phage phi674]|uniref:Uncharacterized protein n=1 Tax=Corynebacterium phage phi674 TaxID=2052822 RepID=A0A2H4PIY4_9CAUD|nr:hypothetical protein FGG66_gp23 [Corynebacterium phage phi674]ATW62941.1 hypothetical protein phi674_gp23 [Corynebacterium phage phi674]